MGISQQNKQVYDRIKNNWHFGTPKNSPPFGHSTWEFFVSHVQRESGGCAASMVAELERMGKTSWLDVNMNDQSEGAMIEGVMFSDAFILILTDGYFQSEYCKKELTCAMDCGKKVILCHPEGTNVGAAIRKAPTLHGRRVVGNEQSVQLVTSNPHHRRTSAQMLLQKLSEGGEGECIIM